MICRKCRQQRRSFSVKHSKGLTPEPIGVCDYCLGLKKEQVKKEEPLEENLEQLELNFIEEEDE